MSKSNTVAKTIAAPGVFGERVLQPVAGKSMAISWIVEFLLGVL